MLLSLWLPLGLPPHAHTMWPMMFYVTYIAGLGQMMRAGQIPRTSVVTHPNMAEIPSTSTASHLSPTSTISIQPTAAFPDPASQQLDIHQYSVLGKYSEASALVIKMLKPIPSLYQSVQSSSAVSSKDSTDNLESISSAESNYGPLWSSAESSQFVISSGYELDGEFDSLLTSTVLSHTPTDELVVSPTVDLQQMSLADSGGSYFTFSESHGVKTDQVVVPDLLKSIIKSDDVRKVILPGNSLDNAGTNDKVTVSTQTVGITPSDHIPLVTVFPERGSSTYQNMDLDIMSTSSIHELDSFTLANSIHNTAPYTFTINQDSLNISPTVDVANEALVTRWMIASSSEFVENLQSRNEQMDTSYYITTSSLNDLSSQLELVTFPNDMTRDVSSTDSSVYQSAMSPSSDLTSGIFPYPSVSPSETPSNTDYISWVTSHPLVESDVSWSELTTTGTPKETSTKLYSENSFFNLTSDITRPVSVSTGISINANSTTSSVTSSVTPGVSINANSRSSVSDVSVDISSDVPSTTSFTSDASLEHSYVDFQTTSTSMTYVSVTDDVALSEASFTKKTETSTAIAAVTTETQEDRPVTMVTNTNLVHNTSTASTANKSIQLSTVPLTLESTSRGSVNASNDTNSSSITPVTTTINEEIGIVQVVTINPNVNRLTTTQTTPALDTTTDGNIVLLPLVTPAPDDATQSNPLSPRPGEPTPNPVEFVTEEKIEEEQVNEIDVAEKPEKPAHTKSLPLASTRPSVTRLASTRKFQATTIFLPNFISSTKSSFSMSSVVTPTSWIPQLYITLRLKTSWQEFCTNLFEFKSLIVTFLEEKAHVLVDQRQVFLMKEQCKSLKYQKRRSAEIAVDFYITNVRGEYDLELTDKLAAIVDKGEFSLEKTPFVDKLLDITVQGLRVRVSETNQKPAAAGMSAGITAIIVISIIAALCLVVIIILQLIVLQRKRSRKKMRSIYESGRSSSDRQSLADSVQLTVLARTGDQLGYMNTGMNHDEGTKDYSANPLDLAGMSHMFLDYDAMEDEFLMLPNNMPKLSEVPQGAEDKNRYANVIPVSETRVMLQKRYGEENSDYINANFIRGFAGEPRPYIATQAPLESTRDDFWRMVWEQQSQVIIMLTDLEEHGHPKCVEYWPNTDRRDTMRIYGDFQVLLQRRDVKKEWVISTMLIKHMERNLCREIHHCWLKAWPFHGVPNHGHWLVRFLEAIRPHMEDSHGPTVVHCSPGTGRTGTLIAVDIGLKSFDITGLVDVLGTVRQLRQERGGAVQTKEQYFFIYKTLYEYALRMSNPSLSSHASSGSHYVH